MNYRNFKVEKSVKMLRVFDKKRKREGKEEEKKRLIKKTYISLSLPYLFLISSPSSPNFIIGNKKYFSNRCKNA
jgi:hypothetical protein